MQDSERGARDQFIADVAVKLERVEQRMTQVEMVADNFGRKLVEVAKNLEDKARATLADYIKPQQKDASWRAAELLNLRTRIERIEVTIDNERPRIISEFQSILAEQDEFGKMIHARERRLDDALERLAKHESRVSNVLWVLWSLAAIVGLILLNAPR